MDGKRGTKTEAGERTVPLNDMAQAATIQLLARARMKRATKPEHYLLPSDDNAAVRLGSFRKSWEALRTKAGLPGLRFHDLRHTFISWCAQRGVPMGVVGVFVGHKSQEVTKVYMHFNDPSTRPVAVMVGNLLAVPKPALEGEVRQ